MSVIDRLTDEAIGHTVDLMRYDARQRQEMLGILEKLRDELAIKVAVAWWYERRGDEVESHPKALPAAVDALLLPYWDGRY